jgi:hypothetical protein
MEMFNGIKVLEALDIENMMMNESKEYTIFYLGYAVGACDEDGDPRDSAYNGFVSPYGTTAEDREQAAYFTDEATAIKFAQEVSKNSELAPTEFNSYTSILVFTVDTHKYEGLDDPLDYGGYCIDDIVDFNDAEPIDNPDGDITATYEYKNLSGAILVLDWWDQHIGYARKFFELFVVPDSENFVTPCIDERLLVNPDKVFNKQFEMVMTAAEVAAFTEPDALKDELTDRLLSGKYDWKWRNPRDVERAIEDFHL